MTWILIIFMSTSASTQAGAASVSVEFAHQSKCVDAGRALIKQAEERGNYVLSWGCFKK